MHPWQIVHPLQGNKLPQNDPEQRRRDLSGYFTAVTAMDAGISQIVNKLDQMDIRENTLLMFSSDNGMNMGHHGIYGKGNGTFPQNMFDTAVQVPAIFSFPGHIAPGAICDELLSHYDVMPTLLDYLGIENPEANSLPGRSFAPLLRGEKLEGREHVVVCDEYGPVRMIRSREWKYVHRYPYGPHEFYDLVKDPDEDHNLIDDQGYQSHIREMKAELDQWFIHYADPRLDGTREPVTGRGQLGLAGVLGNGENHFAQDWQYASHLSPSDQRSA
jgi:arylsulfatase A-like enzyme